MNTKLAIEIASGIARRFEGLYLSPYLCPAGVPTIGFGATYYDDGSRVTMADKAITVERADSLLAWHLEKVYLPAVIQLCHCADTPGRLAALIDFSFNCGIGNLRSSTLRKRVNAGEWHDVPNQLRRWNKAGGRVLRGLTARREAEIGVLGM